MKWTSHKEEIFYESKMRNVCCAKKKKDSFDVSTLHINKDLNIAKCNNLWIQGLDMD